MPAMHYTIQWPDASRSVAYSPSLVIEDFLTPGTDYPLDDFLRRVREATAIANQRVQAALQERIKELTCLYQIARVMERPQNPLEDVFRSVVQALPPAWQYPDIASARIIFDHQKFASSNFQEGRFKQSAELIVNGKSHFLGTGDSFFFASSLPHRYRNIDPGVTRILWVATPASF